MMQLEAPDDYVIGTGETHSVRQLLEEAFGYAGLDWQAYVEVDPRYFRPTEVDHLRADASKAAKELGWDPRVSFGELVRIMVDADFQAIGLEPIGEGLKILDAKFGDWHRWENGVTAVLNSSGNGVD